MRAPSHFAWLFAPAAQGAQLGVALDGYVAEVGVAMAVELVIALAPFAMARQFRAARCSAGPDC